ncbi:beta-lactamase family protein [Hymenobacter sp. 15J16-1T3B]|uniref:serine hydrolase domain-containing protein n=1 Tax=Hymenobacter sp. 15J16-1T3B TaxID=2886941 RepID=UPI001D1210CE|nr:serine hydrolase domain-containing protein [Hymenobacter sp. 15J16-1T3B]MCC3156963.1 beta-lactamase family protein [Hymenobacter sp. 15J16-1T3B]
MKVALVFLVLLVLSLPGLGRNAQRAAGKRVDAFVEQKMRELRIPGLAVAVVKDGQILKKTTYGLANLDWQNKVTEHTNFQIASCTKLLTSTLLLKTMHAGKINLEDPIGTYLDSVPAAWQPVRVKHLVSHSSGIPDYYESNVYLPTSRIVRLVKQAPLLFQPGTKEQYGQSDFMILSYILERIYQKPFVQLLRDEVATPLGMRDGAFDMEYRVKGQYLRTDVLAQKATTYYELNGKPQAYKFLYPQYTYPAGGYFASISDLANWAAGLDNGTLFPRSFADTYIYQRGKIGAADAGFSQVGWAVETEAGTTYGGHSGGPGLGDVWRFPQQGYTFIVLSNDGELLPRFARAIAAFYISELPPKPDIEKFERD